MALKPAAACLLAASLVWIHGGPELGRRIPDATVVDVKPIVMARFVGQVDPHKLEQAAVRAMVEALDDPHSTFMGPEDATAFYEQTDNEFGGLGIEITVRDGLVHVIAPLEDTPAFESGILPGDVIVEVDGRRADYRTADEAARDLKGEPGSLVHLKVLHHGAIDEVEIVVRRALIRVKSVRRPTMEDREDGIGYVRITSFSRQTGEELRAAIKHLEDQGARALVLDLRRNPGGYLAASLEAADLFLEDGTILETRGRDPKAVKVYKAHAEGTLPRRPLVVLVNGASASAAEILAGALQDAGLARIVGTRTYGKGSVQQVTRLRDGSALRLTTEHFYTRSGRRIHRPESAKPEDDWGIRPDDEVDLDALTLQRILLQRSARAWHERNGNGNGSGSGNGNGSGNGSGSGNGNGNAPAGGEAGPPDPPARPSGEPTDEAKAPPLVDTQLEAALAWLRAELAR